MMDPLLEKSVNYFWKKSSIIDVWQGPKYHSESCENQTELKFKYSK